MAAAKAKLRAAVISDENEKVDLVEPSFPISSCLHSIVIEIGRSWGSTTTVRKELHIPWCEGKLTKTHHLQIALSVLFVCFFGNVHNG